MARCKCNNPCTCYFEYDGDRPNTIYTQPYQGGRYNTRKKGSGTMADPYVIEFLDSEEFRVEAGQAHSTTDQIIVSNASGNDGPWALKLNQIDYETPNEIFLSFDVNKQSATAHSFFLSAHKFWFVSAEASFIYSGAGTGVRRLIVYYNGPSGDFGPSGSTVVAGTSSRGVDEDMTLSCSGLAPFMNTTTNTFDEGPDGKFIVGLMQGSGANMAIRNIRFSVIAI